MSDIIYTPPASGGGGQNPTTNYIPLNNGTSNFVDSSIYNDLGGNYLQTEFNSVFGLYLADNGSNSYAFLGDFNYNLNGAYIFVNDTSRLIDINAGDNYNATSLILDDINQIIRTRTAGNDIGLRLDFNNKYFALGDYNVNANGTSLIVDDVQTIIKTMFQGTDIGLNFSFPTRLFSFGDFNGYYGFQNYLQIDSSNNFAIIQNGNGNLYLGDYLGIYNNTTLNISDLNKLIKTTSNGNNIGLKLDFPNDLYFLGDYNGTINGTYILNDDNLKICQLNSNGGTVRFDYGSIELNGPTSPTASGPADHLEVIVNGNHYKIQLLNP